MTENPGPEPGADPPGAVISPARTPLYQAIHADRYQRQGLIKAISGKSGRHLICYVSGLHTMIDRDDTIGLVDLLHNVPCGEDLDFLLHTGGGDIDAAASLLTGLVLARGCRLTCRARFSLSSRSTVRRESATAG